MSCKSDQPAARPTPGEVWWVAVEGSPDPSGGWVVLADEGELGARQIQETFSKARIGVLAAVDAVSLAGALSRAPGERGQEHSVVWTLNAGAQRGQVVKGGSAQALVCARLASPSARILLAQSQNEVERLSARLLAVADSPTLEGVRMDLRDAPRGQGAWGLAQLRSLALGEG